MHVYTYTDPIPNSGQEPIIELWKESWSKFGWHPIVLGERNFIELPFAGAMDFQSRRLPTVNDWRYSRACYRRYLAMAGVGGGMMTDADTINFGFKPSGLPPYSGKLMRFNRQAPCVVYGSVWNYLACVDMFISYAAQPTDLYGDKMHVDDMNLLNTYTGFSEFHDLCSEYRKDNSNREPLIHFPTLVIGKEPGAKEKAIREFLKVKGL